MNDTLVSIIVPVYNAKKYIKQTIDSVVTGNYKDFELLLVDDKSDDGSGEYLDELRESYGDPRMKVFHLEENAGAARARNFALSKAEGRYISYIDADDIWKPEKLEKEILFMREKDAAFVFSGYEFADANGVGTGKVVKVPEKISYREALGNTTIFTSTVLFDTKKIPKENLEMPIIKSEDTALWWKVLRSGITGYGLNENLVLYRRAGKSLSSNKLEALRRIWNLYRKAEHLNVLKSSFYFSKWAINAVKRRV
ncbi:MAG: glycosyltransferase family 2 protein [Lachnospiraceae bacterium]|nr:glycosyltransferase family 2 protein [Lachnospiraceae bacterium]